MIRFGMCGCGGFIERAILPSIRDIQAAAVAAFDVNIDRVGKVSDLFGITHRCSTFEELLLVKDVDALYIASPNVLHKAQTIAAAEAGKHVFCQKPLGMNAAECVEMIAACRANSVRLGVGFCYRFGGAQQKAKEMIRQGVIGDVSLIHFTFDLGDFYNKNKNTAGWRVDPRMSGGGPLMDLAPHMIDLASFFLDDKVESAMAYVRPEPSETEIEMDVLASMQFRGGARMSMDTSFLRCSTHGYTIVGRKGRIHGHGTMPWRTNGKPLGTLALEIDGRIKAMEFSGHEHLEQEISLYCKAIEDNSEPPVPGEAGLHAQSVVDAIYESGRTGRLCTVK